MQERDLFHFKQKVYANYKQVLASKILFLQAALNDLIESTKNETKSSAGDKYETGRAMLQIEQDNVRKQLKDATEQQEAFNRIDINLRSSQIVKGSLVKTQGYLFVSLGLGKLIIDDITVIALSPHCPLGMKLIGLKIGESVTMNSTSYTIESII